MVSISRNRGRREEEDALVGWSVGGRKPDESQPALNVTALICQIFPLLGKDEIDRGILFFVVYSIMDLCDHID